MALFKLTNSDSRDLFIEKWNSRSEYRAGDAHSTMIVRAADECEARQVATDYDHNRCWIDPSTTVVDITEGPSEMVGVL